MTSCVGVRVLRGPDWSSGDDDGGEGHLGTVLKLLDNNMVRVLWDSGKETTCRAGADGKYELRIFDTAPVGVRHTGKTCAACDEQDVYGMLWRCRVCRSCDLCPLCYVTDKHDIKHEFLRVCQPGSQGEPVKKRSVSLKIRAMGIFTGAKVKRGRDWTWADQDGGPGSIGEVLGFENVAPDSSRNIVRVQWPNGKTNSYRLGFNGSVDIACVEEEAGTYYYREHLPVLSTTGDTPTPNTTSSFASTTSDNSEIFAESCSSISSSASGDSGAASQKGEGATTVNVGDKVVIQVGEDRLKELQLTYGGHTATMLRCIGKSGVVDKLPANGAVQVKFESSKVPFRFHPEALTKVPELSVGDMVRIKSDLEQVKLLNKRVGWKSGMEHALGKTGQVTKKDSDGDVVVSFPRGAYMFSPACCEPVSSSVGNASDSDLTWASSGSSASNVSSDDDDNEDGADDYMDLHRDIMRLLANQVFGVPLGGRRGQGQGSSEIDTLFKAVARGDTAAVRTKCQQDKSLVNKVHKGLTALIVASHEGQKDVCVCLLAQGADVNGHGEQGNTPLGAALEGKKEEIALYLLEKGANPNVKNGKGRNPVHLAAYSNMPEVIKVLVQKGADANAKDQYGDTPLHDAIDRDNNDAVNMLLRVKTIDLQATNRKGFNMLQHAALKGNARAVEGILSRDAGQVDRLLDGQFSALHIAANNDHVDCIKVLIKHGNASVNLTGKMNLTPLHLACMKGHRRSMEALLENGAEVNVQDSDGDSPLHCVVNAKVENPGSMRGQNELKERVRMSMLLLYKGAYPDVRNKRGQTMLEACRYSGVADNLKNFMKEHPEVIKRKSGSNAAGASASISGLGGLGLDGFFRAMALPCAAASCCKMADITLLPCQHKILCRDHCLKVSECPLCEKPIERRIHKRGDGEGDLAQACKQM